MSASFLETGSCVRPSGVGLSSPEAAERSPRALVTGDIFHSSGAIIRVKRGFMIHPRKLRHPGSPEPRAGPRPARAEASRLRVRLSVLWPSSLMPASLTLLGAREGPVTGRQVGALQAPPPHPNPPGSWETHSHPPGASGEAPPCPLPGSGLRASRTLRPVCGTWSEQPGHCPRPCPPWGRLEGARPRSWREHTPTLIPGLPPRRPPAGALRGRGSVRARAEGPFPAFTRALAHPGSQ